MSEQGHNIALFFNGEIVETGALGKEFFNFYPISFLWRSTPSVLIGLPLAIFAFFSHAMQDIKKKVSRNLLYLLIFITVYTILLTLSSKKFDRYLIGIYGSIIIIAAFGWFSLYLWLKTKISINRTKYLFSSMLIFVIGIQMIVSLPTYPYYFSYYNPIMGGPQKAYQKVQVGWGEGLDQAARYLNQKENAKDFHVISWYYAGSFSYFFDCHDRHTSMKSSLNPQVWQSFLTSEYAVIYIHQ